MTGLRQDYKSVRNVIMNLVRIRRCSVSWYVGVDPTRDMSRPMIAFEQNVAL